jgi:hypothetical protein
MSFLNNICDKDWKIYGLVFVSCFILIGISNYVLLQSHMRFKGKAKKLNVSYITIAKSSVVAAGIATLFAFLANKLPKHIPEIEKKETREDKSDDDDYDERRRRRRRREESRRDDNLRDDETQKYID